MNRRILLFPDLKPKGINSRTTLHRIRKKDLSFPTAILIGGTLGWFEDEIDAWLVARPRCDKLDKTPPHERKAASEEREAA